MDFFNRHNYNDIFNASLLSIEGGLSVEDTERLKRIRRGWNFYDGYHWEEIPPQDKPEITENYCRTYVNKFVAFEFGKGFAIKTSPLVEGKIVTEDMTLFKYLEKVWVDNKMYKFCVELGQMKSITGDAWVQVKYYKPGEFDDPYGEYPKGRIRVLVCPSSVVFPTYDVHDKDKLEQVIIQYPIEVRENTPILKRTALKKVVYKHIWNRDRIQIWEGHNKLLDIPNKYKIIPFIQVKNFPVAGRSEGLGDLEDLIPLNLELNMKKSDISETIDYHSAPITIVFGAKVSALEKGANKLWGGLPKDAKVQNLELEGELAASVEYVKDLKRAMNEIGNVPEGALGGEQAISNTSGVALQYANMPLIERTRVKRMCSEEGIEAVNKLILLISVLEELIIIPEGVKPKDFYWNETRLADTLPKDTLIELQNIESEMKLGLEDRKGAMTRLGKENIEEKIKEIDEDRKNNPEVYQVLTKTNSGMTNGETPIEQVRKEVTGQNGGK
jgi:hypothetical protein